MVQTLEKKIIQQVEYYFGDVNLPRDKFMQEHIKTDEGWIPVDVLLTFKRLASLSSDPEVIVSAVEKSGLVCVSEDRKKLRRSPDKPVPENTEEFKKALMARTAYAKGFPRDEELDLIEEFLKPHGPIESCIRRNYQDTAVNQHLFKRSCFIVFKDAETCKKFIEAESIKYKDVELIRKWQAVYYEDEKREASDRNKGRRERKEAKQRQLPRLPEEEIDIPKGRILYFDAVSEDQKVSREEIKKKIRRMISIDPAFVDYKRGDAKGYVRFRKEKFVVEFNGKLTDGEMEVEGVKLKFRALEGDEEDEYLKKTLELRCKKRQIMTEQGRRNLKKVKRRQKKRPKRHYLTPPSLLIPMSSYLLE